MIKNQAIIDKIKKSTQDDLIMQDFLLGLLEYESESHGWYSNEYDARIINALNEKDKCHAF